VRYYVSLGERPDLGPVVVDVVELPNGSLTAAVADRTLSVDASFAGSCLSVRVNGAMIDVAFDGSDRRPIAAGFTGRRVAGKVESERTRGAFAARERVASGEPTLVRSPMPGRVVRVLVAPGSQVHERQGLVVLEAMKMENEVRAPSTGTVTHVHVLPGEAVEANAKLVTLA